MSDAPVVWAIIDPRGQVIGGVYEHHDDAMIDCKNRNEVIRNAHADVYGNYCSIKAMAYFAGSIKA